MPRSSRLAALALFVFVAAACRDDGRTLAPAPTVPVSLETTTTAGPTSAPADPDGALSLTSPAFGGGSAIDPSFTCDGLDVPPPLAIAGVPPGTTALAVVVTDADADGYVHWVLAGLPPDVTEMESGLIPPGAQAARSDGGAPGWEGPCPPPGDEPHRYEFVVYALSAPVEVAGTDGRDAIARIEQVATASDVLVGTYARTGPG